jgi:predicted lipid-binding transport protein (Tim44 family)
MKKYFFTLILSLILCINMATVSAEVINESSTKVMDQNKAQPEFNELGRGSYRSPGGSFSGGNRGGISPGTGAGYRTGPRSPSSDVARNPRNQPAQPGQASRWGCLGGLFGGFAAGALIGHFLNPFGGFGGYDGGVFSIISLLIWAVIIYIGFKLLQKLFSRRSR